MRSLRYLHNRDWQAVRRFARMWGGKSVANPSLNLPMSSRFAFFARALVPASLLLVAACQSNSSTKPPSPPPAGQKAEISSEFTASAEVTAIAPAERMVTLRREDGVLLDLQVGEGVRNFDQVAVGDVLRVRYRETLAAEKLPAGSSIGPVEGAFGAARAKKGEKPGAGMGLAVQMRVRIESLDLERDIVVFSLASGELIARRLQTPEGRTFVTGLKIGDIVQLDYTEAIALGVEKL